MICTCMDYGATNSCLSIPQDGYTPLILAAFKGHTDCLRMLTECGAETEARVHVRNMTCCFRESIGFDVFAPALVFLVDGPMYHNF